MSSRPNNDGAKWMVKQIMPLVRSRFPGTKLQIVGRNPSAELLRLSHGCADVEACGEVEDVDDYIRAAKVVVVPLRFCSGTGLKVIEAMASGTPVVSTRLGAEGVDCKDGEHVLLADTPEEFVGALGRLFNDRDLYDCLASRASALVKQRYVWRELGVHVVELYERIIAQRLSK